MTQEFSDIAEMKFEQALAELESIVKKLESGQGELDSAIQDYSRGMALKEHCQKVLADASLKVEKIVKQSEGALRAEPFGTE